MSEDIFFEIHHDLPREGPGRDVYTEKAYGMLPALDKPSILDIGCGPGGPTIKLARLSGDRVIGIDTHQPYLDRLQSKIDEAGLSNRVKAAKQSMFAMNFPRESFDIIWAEGAIYIIGFERGLWEWKKFIKPRGFLVVHEMAWLQPHPPDEIAAYWKKMYSGITTAAENIKIISRCGYDLLGHFPLPEDAWWVEYYGPLEKRIQSLRLKYADDKKALAVLDNEQKEIEMYKKYSRWYGSVFFVMQKL
ncbi:MAG: class I SAM-dependent methyltransferase [Candidatus Aminicenantes bacterium]|nr:class I SAM-dependent methyltransferase [Candidatus Aminicenantes bacterium]